MSGTEAAATLSLKIETTDAQLNLAQLVASYRELKQQLEGKTPSKGLDELGESAAAAAAKVKTLEAVNAQLNAKVDASTAAYHALKSAGTEAMQSISTSMAAGSASISRSLKVEPEAVQKLTAQMEAAGRKGLAALERGVTTQNFLSDFNMMAMAEKNTIASLTRMKEEVLKAKSYMAEFGSESAQLKFGSIALSPGTLVAIEEQLASIKQLYQRSTIELVRITEQEGEAIRASQIRSSVEKVRVTEQLAEQERAAVVASQLRSTVELVRVTEQDAEAVRASQVRSSVEKVRLVEQAAEQERAAVVASQLRSTVELVRVQEQEAEAVRASQVRSSVEKIRLIEQAAEQERAAVIASQIRSSVELVRIKEQEAESIRDSQVRSSVERIRVTEQLAEQERASVLASQIRSSVERIRLTEQLAEQERAAVTASQIRSSVEHVRIKEEEAEAVRASQVRSSVERIRVEEHAAEQERALLVREGGARIALERHYILASEQQRVKSALDARKLMDAGYTGNLSAQFAPQTLSTASSSSVVALEKQMAALGVATKASTAHQAHWNTVTGEGKAAARGLSGALGGLWMTYGSIAPLLAGAAIAGSMKQVFTVGKDLEYQFTMISAISKGAVVDIDKFNSAVAGTMFTPMEAAKGLRVLAQAGLSVQDATSALPSVLKLATVGETDMANAALSATSIMHSFGLEVADFGHIGDVFGKAAAISATSVTEMMAAMKQASAISDMFGVSLEETAAALATLANRGIEGSAAGTAIRNMIKEMANPATEKAADAMRQYGIETHNADGTAKTFTENLKQLSEATGSMSEKAKTSFLETLFNERGVKAANILLKDMGKMESTLKELKNSSEGLGFMNEASIKVSLSTEGMLKTLQSDFQRTLGKVFDEVQPAIQSFIGSLSSAVNSKEFLSFLENTASAVVSLTKALVENIDKVKSFAIVLAGYKGLSVLYSAVSATTLALGLFTPVAATAAAGAATLGAGATAAAAGLAILTAPVLLITVALAAVGFAAYKTYDAIYGMNDAQKKAASISDGYAQGNRTIATEIEKGSEALRKESVELAEQIRLMRLGTKEAKAYADAQVTVSSAVAKGNVQKAKSAYLTAQEKLDAVPKVNFGAGVPVLDPFASERNHATNLRDAAQDSLLSAQADFTKAMAGIDKTATEAAGVSRQRAEIKELADVQGLNDRLINIEKARVSSLAAIQKGGLSEAAKARHQKNVNLGDAAAPLLKNMLPDGKGGAALATEEQRSNRAIEIDALMDNSFKPKERPTSGGSDRGEKKDARTIAADNLSSGLKREQIALATELLNIDIKAAEQTISSVAATEMKNASTKKELLAERELIQAAVENAKKTGDAVNEAKFANDLKENEEKINKQVQQSLLDLTKARVSDKNVVDATTLSSDRYVQDLKFEQDALSKTATEVANLRIEREKTRALEDLSIKKEQKTITPEAAAAEEASIERKANAQKQDDDYQRSFSTGWTKAFKKASDEALDFASMGEKAATSLQDSFADFLFNPFDKGLKGMLQSFGATLQQMISKAVAADLMNKVMGSVTGSSTGGSGAMGMLGTVAGMFGGTGAQVGLANSLPGDSLDTLFKMLPSANGNVFSGSSSLHQYANTVQSSPKTFSFDTLHGFAKGGVFAEAGPEAVMPLSRDSAGRLGVKAQGGGGNQQSTNITVHVNGNSNAPDVRRAAGQGAREALAAFQNAQRYA